MLKYFSVLIPAALLFISCSSKDCVHDTDDNNSTQLNNQIQNTTVAINRTNAVCKVVDVLKGDKNLSLIIKVVSVNDEDNYPSFAVVDAEYTVQPAFAIEENGELIKNERNERLNSLSKMKKGDSFNCYLSYENMKGWFIYDIIN